MTTTRLASYRYNKIPLQWLNNVRTVFEVGANDGYAQTHSTLASWFKIIEAIDEYLGIDIIPRPDKVFLKDILYETDIRDTLNLPQFDCVLCINVLEHIDYEFWNEIILKMWSLVKQDGILIISTPYKQKWSDYVHRDITYGHKIFEIDEHDFRIMRAYAIPEILIEKTDLFRGDNASLGWAILRKIKRIVTRHPYRKNQEMILLKWRKNDV